MKITLPTNHMLVAAAIAMTFAMATPLAADDDIDRAAQETEKAEAMMEDQKDTATEKAEDSDAEGMAEKVKHDAMEKLKGLD